VLEFIVTMGGDCALVSDAARARLEIRDHYDSLNNKSVDRISKSSHLAADVDDIKHHAMKNQFRHHRSTLPCEKKRVW
jgi:hypothetical protein